MYGVFILHTFCPPLSRKRGDIKSHLSVCPSVCPSVTKTLTLAITFALLQIELWYLVCVFLVTRPFRWYHIVTLTVTFDILQGQICCRAGNHNSLNLLVKLYDVPVGFVAPPPPPPHLRHSIALYVVAEGWLLLAIGWFVLFLSTIVVYHPASAWKIHRVVHISYAMLQ